MASAVCVLPCVGGSTAEHALGFMGRCHVGDGRTKATHQHSVIAVTDMRFKFHSQILAFPAFPFQRASSGCGFHWAKPLSFVLYSHRRWWSAPFDSSANSSFIQQARWCMTFCGFRCRGRGCATVHGMVLVMEPSVNSVLPFSQPQRIFLLRRNTLQMDIHHAKGEGYEGKGGGGDRRGIWGVGWGESSAQR